MKKSAALISLVLSTVVACSACSQQGSTTKKDNVSIYNVESDSITESTTFASPLVETISNEDESIIDVRFIAKGVYEFDVSVGETATVISDGVSVKTEGYVVGVNSNGDILLKDLYRNAVAINSEYPTEIIAVKGVSQTYSYGDRITVKGNFYNDGNESQPNCYVDATETPTIISEDNYVNYYYNNVPSLTKWSDWTSLFNESTLAVNSLIRLSGNLYCHRDSNGESSLLSANYNARSLDAIKPDGIHTVCINDTTLTANTDANVTEYFKNNSSTSYPGSPLKKDILILYTGISNGSFQLTMLKTDWLLDENVEIGNNEYTNQEILLEVADAYYRQHTQIQYDQYNYRRHMTATTPEQATSQNMVYLDCSSFVNSVYYEAFGINIIPAPVYKEDTSTQYHSPNTSNYRNYARDNRLNEDVVGYWVNSDFTTAKAQEKLLSQVRRLLEVGDIISYRHGNNADSAGHVYIYLGNDTFMHCYGTAMERGLHDPSFNVFGSNACDKASDQEKSNGAIDYISASNLFENKSHSRYLFRNTSSDQVQNFCVIRPLARGTGVTPTQQSLNRMAIKGLDLEKTVDVGINNAVFKGSEITYNVTAKNNSASAITTTLGEVIPNNTTFKSASEGITNNNGNLSADITIPAGETKTYTWTVTVNDDAPAGALIESNQTLVGGIQLSKTVHTVSSYTQEQINNLVSKAKEYTTSGKTFDSPTLMASTLYYEALGATIYDNNYQEVQTLLDQVFDKDNRTVKEDSALYNILAPKLYGGAGIYNEWQYVYYYDMDLVRLITKDHLSAGDIIVAVDSYRSTEISYVYLGSGEFIRIASTTADSYTGAQNTCELVTMVDDQYDKGNILSGLFCFDQFAIFRPSMVE